MFLKEIETRPPEGVMRIVFQKMEQAGAGIPDIMHLFRFKKRNTDHLVRFTEEVMRGPSPLSTGTRELIGAFVSSRNNCGFCAAAHAPVAAQLLGEELVQQVLSDFENSRLDRRHKALFRYLAKLAENPASIAPEDIKTLKEAGWSEEAIYDALTVAAMFKFYNTWNNGAGVALMSSADFAHSSRRLLSLGYCMDFGFKALLRVIWLARKEIRPGDWLELLKVILENSLRALGLGHTPRPLPVRTYGSCRLQANPEPGQAQSSANPTCKETAASVSLVGSNHPAA